MARELVEDALTLDEMAGDVEGIGQPFGVSTVDLEIGDPVEELVLHPIPHLADAGLVLVAVLNHQIEGAGKTDDEGNVFSAGPSTVFLVATQKVRTTRRSAADEQGSDALGSVQLVA